MMVTAKVNENVTGYWRAEKLLQLIQELGLNEQIEAGQEFLQKRRTVDFFISPGTINARLQDDRGLPIRVRLQLEIICDEKWNAILQELAQSALFLAKLLVGQLPAETIQIFQRCRAELFPNSAADLALTCECGAHKALCKHSAALYLLASNHFVSDPFSLLTWRGRSREQVLTELRRSRQTLRTSVQQATAPGSYQLLPSLPTLPLEQSLSNFWSMGPRLAEVKYSIKADELPASLLRRLDSIPVGDLQTAADLALEDAYAHVARRAQSMGLGL